MAISCTAPSQIYVFATTTEPVWKVARYTSAAPMFFKEFENYVDGGVLANNPCDYGLTAIQNYYRQRGIDLPIALVVSVGTGIYPAEELGRVDAHEFLFFGKHWFNATDTLRKRTRNLISLLSNAVRVVSCIWCVLLYSYFVSLRKRSQICIAEKYYPQNQLRKQPLMPQNILPQKIYFQAIH